MGRLEEFFREPRFHQMARGSQVARGQSREGAQGTSTVAHLRLGLWATPRSVLTCIAYVCLVTPSALGVALPLSPWNISCFNAHASSLNILNYAPGSPPWPSQHSTCPPSWRPQASTFPSTCCPSPYFCLLEEDRPATTPVITTQEYPRAHKDP
ncbi:hypothetical protein E2C01_085533 [Portunus trituberculatus]|uniref:Uncharacterized protein n=1 Tax=Portunus trituberculatus TaxID=210409 RepID=A0A5B7J303_PORTR|nr:hypothetical protein [Portunus trituberculatus]